MKTKLVLIFFAMLLMTGALVAVDVEYIVIKQTSIVLNIDENRITPSQDYYSDLGASWTEVRQIMDNLETIFDIEIPDEDAEKITTVGSAISYISGKL